MTDLTEQYINGNLQDGDEYYIENKDGEVSTMYLYNDTMHWHSFKVKKLKVLAKIPTYQEYLALQSDSLAKNEASEIIAELEERLKKTQGLELDLRRKNHELKELLKECREAFILLDSETVDFPFTVERCINKIDEVLDDRH